MLGARPVSKSTKLRPFQVGFQKLGKVSILEGGNQEEINKKVEELINEETIEYAALLDLAFLKRWHRRFENTLKVVSKRPKWFPV